MREDDEKLLEIWLEIREKWASCGSSDFFSLLSPEAAEYLKGMVYGKFISTLNHYCHIEGVSCEPPGDADACVYYVLANIWSKKDPHIFWNYLISKAHANFVKNGLVEGKNMASCMVMYLQCALENEIKASVKKYLTECLGKRSLRIATGSLDKKIEETGDTFPQSSADVETELSEIEQQEIIPLAEQLAAEITTKMEDREIILFLLSQKKQNLYDAQVRELTGKGGEACYTRVKKFRENLCNESIKRTHCPQSGVDQDAAHYMMVQTFEMIRNYSEKWLHEKINAKPELYALLA